MQIDVSEQEKAFVTRTIDAAVTYEPVRTKLLAAGGHTLFDSKEIPNEIVDVLVVREQYLNQHPDIVRHLMNGWFKALAYITSNPGKAATILGQRMKLNVDDTLNTYKGLQLPDRKLNAELLNTRPPKLLTTVRKLITIMLQTGLLVKEFSPAKPFTTDVQSRILNQGKTK